MKTMNELPADKALFIIMGLMVLCILVGWLCPIEGPFDYVCDEFASQPAHRSPKKAAPPLQPYQVIIDINDLSEEDFEALQEIFVNR